MPNPFQLTADQYLDREAANVGVCLRCASWSGGTDPGAGQARCGFCGAHALHGIEQALLLGAVQIHPECRPSPGRPTAV